MYNFLFMCEDGNVAKSNTINDKQHALSKAELLFIIDISGGDPKYLRTDGFWENIENV